MNASRNSIRDLIEALRVVSTGVDEALATLTRLLNEQTRHIDYHGIVTKRRTPVLALWKSRFAFAGDWCMSTAEEAIALDDANECVMLLTGTVNGALPHQPGARAPEEWSVRSAWRIEAKFGLITEFAEFGDASSMQDRIDAFRRSNVVP